MTLEEMQDQYCDEVDGNCTECPVMIAFGSQACSDQPQLQDDDNW